MWDRNALPYLVTVTWSEGHPPLAVVQSRDQRRMAVLGRVQHIRTFS